MDDLAEAEQKLKNLERQIKALGPINLDAIAQFDAAKSSRSNFKLTIRTLI